MLNIRFAYRFFLSELKTYGYGPAEQYQQAKLLGEDMTGIKHFGWREGKMEVGWRPVGLWAAPSSGRIALHPCQREELSEVCGLWGEKVWKGSAQLIVYSHLSLHIQRSPAQVFSLNPPDQTWAVWAWTHCSCSTSHLISWWVCCLLSRRDN